jgi:hypothetical protein
MSELVQVRIKGTVVTQRYGTLSSGDILRTDAEFAKHLVDDCAAAEYLDAAKAVKAAEVTEQAAEVTEQAAEVTEQAAVAPVKASKKK